jgi:hypothetical protein
MSVCVCVLGVLKPFRGMTVSFSCFGKFSHITLLNMFSIPLFCTSSSVPVFYNLDL